MYPFLNLFHRKIFPKSIVGLALLTLRYKFIYITEQQEYKLYISRLYFFCVLIFLQIVPANLSVKKKLYSFPSDSQIVPLANPGLRDKFCVFA